MKTREENERLAKPPTIGLGTITVKQLITLEQLAAYLQQQPGTIYAHVRRAKSRTDPPKNPIPFRKVNDILRFDFDEIVEWTKRGAVID